MTGEGFDYATHIALTLARHADAPGGVPRVRGFSGSPPPRAVRGLQRPADRPPRRATCERSADSRQSADAVGAPISRQPAAERSAFGSSAVVERTKKRAGLRAAVTARAAAERLCLWEIQRTSGRRADRSAIIRAVQGARRAGAEILRGAGPAGRTLHRIQIRRGRRG